MISAAQVRAARALLKWENTDLAEKTGLGSNTISLIENEKTQPRASSMEKLQAVFESAGIEFTGNGGVQWAGHQVRTLTGVEGLKAFFGDVRYVAQHSDEEIIICGIAEEYLEDKLGEFVDYQRKEMASYEKVRMRCLIEESDLDLGASDYCQYRWQAKENFSNVPFYIYGDKMAIIVTTAPEDPLILLIQNRTITSAYRRQFDAMWAAAKDPNIK
ncbi:MAG: helix-turn-helix domain-containing protein [Bdellovibrionales bacterium]